jgi:NTE family protein
MARTGSWPERRQEVHARHDRQRATAFVLPGGATRGATQVGMLAALTEAGVTPDFVVGTSVGALNGVCYSADPTVGGLDRIAQRWTAAPRSQIFPFSTRDIVRRLRERSDHLLPNDGLRRWVEANTVHARLEDFPIPVHVIATDVATGEAVVLSTGDAVTALLASTAIPRVFPPITIDGRVLYDGAVAADRPVEQAVALGATTVYVLPAATDSPVEAALWRFFDGAFGGPPPDPVDPAALGATVHVLPAPRAVTHPYTFRSSGQLIDQARALTRSFLAGDDRSAHPSEVAWPSLTPSIPSSTLRPASA